MNLSSNPTVSELRELLGRANDMEGHHVLWVDRDGNVHLDTLSDGETPAEWTERNEARLQFRYETYYQGNGNVGPLAAADEGEMQQLYNSLCRDWKARRWGYIDFQGA